MNGEEFKSLIAPRLAAEGRAWLDRQWPSAAAPPVLTRFRAAFAGAPRRLGAETSAASAGQLEALRRAGVVAPERWPLDQLARVALLRAAAEALPAAERAPFVRQVYLRGDYREQAAVLRALPLLPAAADHLALAIDACRTNVIDVFEAIACENPYPAAHFPELNFNQLVIKAVFLGLAVARIAGLDRRNNSELRRIARDFAAERRAAGRTVPGDLDLILA
jgi:hypothetical protein